MIIDNVDADQVRKYAADSGMVTLREAGFRRIIQGQTTLEEIMEVVADQD